MPNNYNTDDFVSTILDYKISSDSLDLYPILSSKIDNAQLICKLLSYLCDSLSGISKNKIKELQDSLDEVVKPAQKPRRRAKRGWI